MRLWRNIRSIRIAHNNRQDVKNVKFIDNGKYNRKERKKMIEDKHKTKLMILVENMRGMDSISIC